MPMCNPYLTIYQFIQYRFNAGLFFTSLRLYIVCCSTHSKSPLAKTLTITLFICIVSACGGGLSFEDQESSAINAVDVTNKNQFSQLSENRKKQPITFNVVENIAYMQGIMDSTIPHLVRNLIKHHPAVETIVMQHVLGTIDFSATLEAGRLVREACLTTVVPYSGKIASGGVHFFFAGCKRIIENGGKLGIHTWETGVFDNEGNLTQSNVASEFSITNPVHTPYLEYQAEMGIAEELYWLMIDTPIDEIYYLTNNEIEYFNISTTEQKTWGATYRLAINPNAPPNFGVARFYVQDGIALMHGSISAGTPMLLRNMLADHPEVHTLEFGFVKSTLSPFIRYAVELGYAIRKACLTTKIGQSSYVLHAAIHSFIAGCEREFETGGQLGIASWYSADVTILSEHEFMNDDVHAEYLNYYTAMGIPRSFYSYQLKIPQSNPQFINRNDLIEFDIL